MRFKTLFNAILFFLLISGFILLSLESGTAAENRSLYSQAVGLAREGDRDFAFMHFKEFLRENSKSKLAPKALFAIGEYYFSLADYSDASGAFNAFIDRYPDSKAAVFVLIYLFELAKKYGDQESIKELKRRIVVFKKLKFLFSDFKKYNYLSPFSNRYKALYYIDRVEVYINDELFTKITY